MNNNKTTDDIYEEARQFSQETFNFILDKYKNGEAARFTALFSGMMMAAMATCLQETEDGKREFLRKGYELSKHLYKKGNKRLKENLQ